MYKQDNHIINREVFEFSCRETAHAFALQHEMETGLQQKINRSISTVLDEINEGQTTLKIDKLELDLGQVAFANMMDSLPGIFYNELRRKLLDLVAERKYIEPSFYKNAIIHNLELLEYFFATGSLPWWATTEKDFSVNEMTSTFIKDNPAEFKALLWKHFANEKFRERLYFQLNVDVYEQLVELLFSSHRSSNSFSQQINQFEDFIKGILIKKNEYSFIIDARKKIIRGFSELLSTCIFSNNQLPLHLLLKEKIELVFENLIDLKALEHSMNIPPVETLQSIFQTIQNEVKENDQKETVFLPPGTKINESESKIYIQNAGLVLVAAYLPLLFNRLEWLEEGKFSNKEFQYRAIFLLHFLATGQNTAPEYTLQLNKILCGVDLEEPIPFSVELNGRERDEANSLLDSIITHWTAIKNSSVEGLQGTFLLRDGLLSFINEHWLINVDRKGYDILLDQVPWSWKTIQTGWMDTYLDVEW